MKLFSSLKLATISTVLLTLGVSLAQADSKPVVKALTYEAMKEYGVTKALTPILETQCACTIEWSTVKNQHLILNTLSLDKATGKTNYDVLVGVNVNDAFKVRKVAKELSAKSKPVPFTKLNYSQADVAAFNLGNWDNFYALPISSSPIAVFVNTDKVKPTPSYSSWKDWIENDKHSFIFANPETNDIARAMRRIIAYYYPTEAEQKHAWEKIKSRTVTVGTGWSSSYGVFSKGESEEAAGYASSIIYHRLVEKAKFNLEPLLFADGTVLLTDSVVVPANNSQPEASKKLAMALVSPQAQQILMSYNSANPVIKFAPGVLSDAETKVLKQLGAYKLLPIDYSKEEPSIKPYLEAFK